MKRPDRAFDVLHLDLAHVLNAIGYLVPDLVTCRPRNTDPAWFGMSLQPGGDVDAITMNVIALDNDVAQIDPNSELEVVRFGLRELLQRVLNLDGTIDRIDDRAEFGQETVACRLEHPPSMALQCRLNNTFENSIKLCPGPRLVAPHAKGITDDICDQDRSKAAHCAFVGHLMRFPPSFDK